jgi:hypothetical protein
MDKKLKIAIPVIAGALAITGGVSAAFAGNAGQAPAPERPAVAYDTASTNGTQDETASPYYCGEYGGMMGRGAGLAVTPQVADLLGTTIADLRAQLEAGRTLAEIAAERGVSLDQLIETVMAPYNDHLDIMVKYGYLTQDEALTLRQQARERLQTAMTSQYGDQGDRWEYMEEMMDEYGHGGMMDEYGHGGMMGGWGGMMGGSGGMMGGGGGMMDGWGGFPQTPDTNTTPRQGFGGMMGGFGGGMMR